MTESQNTKPLLFISHKHLDRNIAGVLTDWIVRSTSGRVRIYQSSDPSAEGPRIGQPLTDELRRAIDEAAVVILVYTQADYNWDYCMWECGMASRSPGDTTRTVVLQCGEDAPRAFIDKLRVRADNEDDVKKLAITLLTRPGFFHGQGAITDLPPEGSAVDRWAEELFTRLAEVIPHNGRPRKWSIWPSLKLEMDRSVVEELKEARNSERGGLAREALRTKAAVRDATPGAANLFDLRRIADGTEFSKLVELWEEDYSGRECAWLDVMAEQLIIGALEQRSHPIEWAPMREIQGTGRFLPGAGSLRNEPDDRVSISFHFYASPGAEPVTSRMARIDRIHRIDLRREEPSGLRLVDVLSVLENRGWSRLPITGRNGEPKYIIHTAMIDRYMRCSAVAGRDLEALTLADLLDDSDMRDLFTSSFAMVGEDADLTQAASAIAAVPGCQDAFVTKTGDAGEPVVGWITNRDLEEALEPMLSA